MHKAMLPSAVTLASKVTCLERDLLALRSRRGSPSLCWSFHFQHQTQPYVTAHPGDFCWGSCCMTGAQMPPGMLGLL